MLKFEGLKEFDIKKIDDNQISRDFQMSFSDDMLDEEESEIVENRLNNYNFSIKDENVKIDVIYNIDLDTATITLTIYCPLTHLGQISEERFFNFIEQHKMNFKEYYDQIKPYQ